jgi:undecaprenyl-diphosphatase
MQARLSREGFMGLHLTLGILFLSLATWNFAARAEDVANGDPLTITDARFSNWLHVHATRPLTIFLLVVTHLHSTLGVTVMTLAVCIYLWRRKLRGWVFTLIVTVYGGMLLNLWLKGVFQRARPHFDDPILTLTSYSFPSGHAMISMVFYGALSAIIFSQVQAWRWRLLSVMVSLVLIALVGFSRIYLGVHYLSDVLGAIAEGAAWLALCLTEAGGSRQKAVSRRQKAEGRRQKAEGRRQKAESSCLFSVFCS